MKGNNMCKTLDAVVSLKRKKILHKKLAPWYNDHTRALKQALLETSKKMVNQTTSFLPGLEIKPY